MNPETQRAMRAARKAQGPTTKGTIPVNQYRPELAHLHGKERRNARMKLVTREQAALGLTARGTRRMLRHPATTPQAIAYAALKAEIDAGDKVLPIVTGFRESAAAKRGPVNSRELMTNLISRGATKEAA